MDPLVSILIPAFNSEEWIAATIESALAQTWAKKEIIVVDDGSTDQTLAIARQFSAKGVRVVTQPNQGAAAARNKAFSGCHGDYVQWLDADDLLAPDKIENQMKAMGDSPSPQILMSSAWGHFIYRPQKARFSPTSVWCDLAPVEWVLRNFEQNHWMQPAAWLVSRELTRAAGPWDTRLTLDDDGEYFCRVVLASDSIRFVPTARTFYRRTPNSLSTVDRSSKKWESRLLAIELQIQHLRAKEDGERARAACRKCLQRYLACFYPERPDLVERTTQLALSLGRQLDPPQLGWKYAWLRPLFGWRLAKRAQFALPQFKLALSRSLDRALSRWESNRS